MSTQATWGYGSQLQIDNGSGFVTVAEVMDITGPVGQRDQADVTNHDSPNGFEEFILTLKRSGEVSFKINLIPGDATHDQSTGLMSLFDNGDRVPMRIVWPNSIGQIAFDGLVRSFKPNSPVNAQITADVTIKVTGLITMTS